MFINALAREYERGARRDGELSKVKGRRREGSGRPQQRFKLTESGLMMLSQPNFWKNMEREKASEGPLTMKTYPKALIALLKA